MNPVLNRFVSLLMLALMLITYLTSVLTAYNLVRFLSIIDDDDDDESTVPLTAIFDWNTICWHLVADLGLLMLFLIAHSILLNLKEFAKRVNFESIFRSFYVLVTNIVLYLMFAKWQPTNYVLWSLTNLLSKQTLFACHLFVWFILYGSVLILDCNELLGVKQIYNKLLQLQNPIVYKSKDLQNLYANFRHPGIAWISLILLTYPVMTLDRLLIATVFVPYMYTSWKVTPNNVQYLKTSVRNKKLL